jgi:hypothetical protein
MQVFWSINSKMYCSRDCFINRSENIYAFFFDLRGLDRQRFMKRELRGRHNWTIYERSMDVETTFKFITTT